MARVEIRPGESQEKLLKRFRKKVMRAGILSTARKKRFYISKSEKRRLALRKAIRKQRKRVGGNPIPAARHRCPDRAVSPLHSLQLDN